MPHFFICKACWRMLLRNELVLTQTPPVYGCPCGGTSFTTTSLAPWRLSTHDRKWLKTVRIASDDSLPFDHSGSRS